MALRHLLMLCTLTALALSGCSGDEPATETAAATPPRSAQARPEAVAEAAAVETVVQSFSHDGMTAVGGCAYLAVAYPCAWPASDNAIVVEVEGTATRVQATLTWTPQADYQLGFFVAVPDGEGWSFSESRWATGSSGQLTLDVDVTGMDAGRLLVGANSYVGQGAAGLGGGASVPFDFHLEGTAESVVSS